MSYIQAFIKWLKVDALFYCFGLVSIKNVTQTGINAAKVRLPHLILDSQTPHCYNVSSQLAGLLHTK